MAQDEVLVYAGGFQAVDDANTAGAIVRRASDSSVNVGKIIATIAALSQGLNLPSESHTTTVTLTITSPTIQKCNATGGAYTTTLPAAAASGGILFAFVKTDSSGNLPTIKGSGSELIGTANTYTGLAAQGNGVILYCDGTQWWVIAKN